MKKRTRIIAFAVCLVLIASILLYNNGMIFPKIHPDVTVAPDISVTVIDTATPAPAAINQAIDEGTITSIEAIVLSLIGTELEETEFVCGTGAAYIEGSETPAATGLYYYSPSVNMFSSDYLSVGFVEIATEGSAYQDLSTYESVIAVLPVDDAQTDLSMVCSYSYKDIPAFHFIYQGMYVVGYQQTPMRVVYSVHEDNSDIHNLTIGSLYDFDRKRFVYDTSIYEEYVAHSGISLFSETDYHELEETLKHVSEEQLAAGFVVNEYNIVYPQWISFAKYSYAQLKWTLCQKPKLRDAYVQGIIDSDLRKIYQGINQSFEKLTNEYVVIFE